MTMSSRSQGIDAAGRAYHFKVPRLSLAPGAEFVEVPGAGSGEQESWWIVVNDMVMVAVLRLILVNDRE